MRRAESALPRPAGPPGRRIASAAVRRPAQAPRGRPRWAREAASAISNVRVRCRRGGDAATKTGAPAARTPGPRPRADRGGTRARSPSLRTVRNCPVTRAHRPRLRSLADAGELPGRETRTLVDRVPPEASDLARAGRESVDRVAGSEVRAGPSAHVPQSEDFYDRPGSPVFEPPVCSLPDLAFRGPRDPYRKPQRSTIAVARVRARAASRPRIRPVESRMQRRGGTSRPLPKARRTRRRSRERRS